MSTKIYEAYKVVNDLSMDGLMGYLFQVRKEYINDCVEFVKRAKGDDDFNTVSDELRKGLAGGERSCYNFKADIMVYFLDGEKYVQFFGMNFTSGKALGELHELYLIDYHYQNQSDAWYEYTDEEYTEEELKGFEKDYEERKEVWDKIYETSCRPNEVGLVFELCTKDDYYKIAGKAFDYEGFGD